MSPPSHTELFATNDFVVQGHAQVNVHITPNVPLLKGLRSSWRHGTTSTGKSKPCSIATLMLLLIVHIKFSDFSDQGHYH